jgi:L,D-transpeptidase YcbB
MGGFFMYTLLPSCMRFPIRMIWIIACCWVLQSCNGNSAEKNNPPGKDTIPPKNARYIDQSLPGNFSSQSILHFDSIALIDFIKKYDSLRPFKNELVSFYRNRNYAYAWFDDQGLIEQSADLYNRILHLEEEGLPRQQPYLNTFMYMMGGDDSLNLTQKEEPEKEIMLTAQYLAYARKAWTGLPESASREMAWHIPRKKIDYKKYLDSLLSSTEDATVMQEPVYYQYNLLKKYLKRFQEVEKKGTWLIIKSDKKKYQQGDTAQVIKSIRKKLFLAGDLDLDSGSPVFDQSMKEAVKKFQHRYGLKEDGIVGQTILKEMNAPLSKRMQQIIVNMERCRWMNNDPTGNFLLVNIPQFQLLVYEHDSLVWACNVVVGKEIHKTAIFQGTVRYIVFSPYWNVPSSILNKEIMPAVRRNPNYLESHDMEWHDGRLRQRPGPENALGKVKFLFPNNFKMYLHDSPSKSLFEQEKRTFSHGCIRVAEARKLALYLLRDDKNWPESKIDNAMNSRKEQTVTLKEPIPVSIVYFTAWVDQEGRINFRNDIYQRDSRLMEALFAKK